MKPAKVILAPDGFPWCAAISWIVVVAAVMTIGMIILHSTTLGGNFVIAALFGNAAAATMLGRC